MAVASTCRKGSKVAETSTRVRAAPKMTTVSPKPKKMARKLTMVAFTLVSGAAMSSVPRT
ncbi:hypothetical protein ACFPRL_26435 [Pseudoclavibacter helvolus]